MKKAFAILFVAIFFLALSVQTNAIVFETEIGNFLGGGEPPPPPPPPPSGEIDEDYFEILTFGYQRVDPDFVCGPQTGEREMPQQIAFQTKRKENFMRLYQNLARTQKS